MTNAGGPKTVTLTLTGTAADQENQLVDPDSTGNVCFESPTQFVTENSTAAGGEATIGPDGLYYGNLPLCDDGDGDNDFTDTRQDRRARWRLPVHQFRELPRRTRGRRTRAGSGSTSVDIHRVVHHDSHRPEGARLILI